MAAAQDKERLEGHPEVEQRLKQPEEEKRLAEQEEKIEHILQEVERDHKSAQPITDDTDQVVLTPSQPQQPTVITLPLTEEEIKHGLHHKIIDSIRWLAAWCVRMGKKAIVLGLRVVYPSKDANNN